MLEILASDLRPFAQDVLVAIVCICALVWGGGPERAVALVWLTIFELGNLIYQGIASQGYQVFEVDFWLATTDLIAGAAFIIVALWANRNYTLFIAAMQLLAMTAHLARGLVEAILPIAYAFMVATPGWFQLLFLGGGLARHILRKRRHGDYRDWRVGRWNHQWLDPRLTPATLFHWPGASKALSSQDRIE
ncbi:hypothetical protein [Erythrobacter sp.]|jgi:hypothetical protein|uniref:hypothetical protein n=1 Tax=Erythrobacter sp. TaxID=1042 RepID=UPI002EA9FEE7|nr:hypothetical protein [Erythrobacter sp.]